MQPQIDDNPAKVRFNVEDFYKMMDAGILPENNQTEIINGELVYKKAGHGEDDKFRFEVEDFYKMMELGLLESDNTTEIINGELIKIMPIGTRHAGIVEYLDETLREILKRQVNLWVQNPVRITKKNEPQPDVAILRRREDFYRAKHPTPADVLLLIEVSDTTFRRDKTGKVPLYAAAEINELWLVSLPKERVEIYTEPRGGIYQKVEILERGDICTSKTLPDLSLAVDEILGAEQTN